MIPHDILNQILDHPPHDDDVEWDGDVIRIHSGSGSAQFRRHHYTRIDLNLSQGIVYFFTGTTIVLKLAIELRLQAITTPQSDKPTELERQQREGGNGLD